MQVPYELQLREKRDAAAITVNENVAGPTIGCLGDLPDFTDWSAQIVGILTGRAA